MGDLRSVMKPFALPQHRLSGSPDSSSWSKRAHRARSTLSAKLVQAVCKHSSEAVVVDADDSRKAVIALVVAAVGNTGSRAGPIGFSLGNACGCFSTGLGASRRAADRVNQMGRWARAGHVVSVKGPVKRCVSLLSHTQ